MRTRNSVLPVLTVLTLGCALLAIPSFADSQARIVRLSQVDGSVEIDRNTGRGFEKAFLNLPITQGMKVKTGFDGRAEIELENGSAIRIVPDTVISFPDLSLRDSGGKVSTVNLQEGTAYVNFLATKNDKDDELLVTFGQQKLALTQAVHLRVQMNDADASVAVFKGEARVSGPAGEIPIEKNKTATFDLASDKFALAKNQEPDPYDEWDKAQTQYHDRYTADNAYSGYSPYAYGSSDLNYYGNFSTVPGYGTMWQPYFAGAGWDPYLNGAWAYSPGYGYGWVSGYPWGWTPYHYGSWIYVPSYGWGWQPGGSWAGLNTQPRIGNGPTGWIPPKPPAAGNSTVAVNGGSFPRTTGGFFGNKMTIPQNSAGLGVPRGLVRNLGSLSQQAQQRGAASTRLPLSTGSYSGYPSGFPTGTAGSGRTGGFTPRSVGPSHSSGGHIGSHH
jgi:hypothetical protein